jgi:uncharacterized membrane protein YheB (UPF0754 family)
MMWWIYVTPFIAALSGWILMSAALRLLFHPVRQKNIAGFSLQGLVPGKQAVFAQTAGKLGASFLSVKEIEEKITHPDNVKKIMPQAEAHIDEFLRVKLVKSMPVVGMFVGDKTINTLKLLFMTELKELFPEIMKKYMGRLQEDFDIEKMIRDKIAAIPPESIEKACSQLLKKQFIAIKFAGAIFGFVISLIPAAVFLALIHRQ